MSTKHRIGIIGGSGLYHIEGFTNQKWVKVKTPFGDPSDEFLTGTLAGRDVVFLPRHARGHRILPGELNHRANIYGMKKLGAQWIISVSAAIVYAGFLAFGGRQYRLAQFLANRVCKGDVGYDAAAEKGVFQALFGAVQKLVWEHDVAGFEFGLKSLV